MIPKSHHIDSEAYLRKVRLCRCVTCGKGIGVEAAHIRFADAKHGKEEAGMGRKPSDSHTLPLCAWCHRMSDAAQHSHCERDWWDERGISDPVALAEELHRRSGSQEDMRLLISEILIMGQE